MKIIYRSRRIRKPTLADIVPRKKYKLMKVKELSTQAVLTDPEGNAFKFTDKEKEIAVEA